MAKHVAIKCTYNNGDEGIFVGFNGTCSENIIKWNIEKGRVWCSQRECKCRKYYDNGFQGKRPIDPCWESQLFRNWKFGAGMYHTGKKAGKFIHLSNVDRGKIAILTTRFPNEKEIDRRIIGFFKIARVINDPGDETVMIADKYYRIRLPMEVAKHLYFWDYYSTRGGALWGTGLIRYLSDNQTSRILLDIKETVHDEKAKEMLGKLLKNDFASITPLPPSGHRIRKSENIVKRISVFRKYGSGGEGNEHKKLKDWIASNPKELGLLNVKNTEIEHVFISGDAVDVIFELDGGKYVVVEIETIDPLPGYYQALKYKVLKCAELGQDIKSPNVEAFLVAWSIPEEIKRLCNKYGIRFLEKKL